MLHPDRAEPFGIAAFGESGSPTGAAARAYDDITDYIEHDLEGLVSRLIAEGVRTLDQAFGSSLRETWRKQVATAGDLLSSLLGTEVSDSSLDGELDVDSVGLVASWGVLAEALTLCLLSSLVDGNGLAGTKLTAHAWAAEAARTLDVEAWQEAVGLAEESAETLLDHAADSAFRVLLEEVDHGLLSGGGVFWFRDRWVVLARYAGIGEDGLFVRPVRPLVGLDPRRNRLVAFEKPLQANWSADDRQLRFIFEIDGANESLAIEAVPEPGADDIRIVDGALALRTGLSDTRSNVNLVTAKLGPWSVLLWPMPITAVKPLPEQARAVVYAPLYDSPGLVAGALRWYTRFEKQLFGIDEASAGGEYLLVFYDDATLDEPCPDLEGLEVMHKLTIPARSQRSLLAPGERLFEVSVRGQNRRGLLQAASHVVRVTGGSVARCSVAVSRSENCELSLVAHYPGQVDTEHIIWAVKDDLKRNHPDVFYDVVCTPQGSDRLSRPSTPVRPGPSADYVLRVACIDRPGVLDTVTQRLAVEGANIVASEGVASEGVFVGFFLLASAADTNGLDSRVASDICEALSLDPDEVKVTFGEPSRGVAAGTPPPAGEHTPVDVNTSVSVEGVEVSVHTQHGLEPMIEVLDGLSKWSLDGITGRFGGGDGTVVASMVVTGAAGQNITADVEHELEESLATSSASSTILRASLAELRTQRE